MTNEEFQTLVLQRLDQLDVRIHIGLDGVETRLRGLETLHRHHMQQVNKLFNSLRKSTESVSERVDAVDERIAALESRVDRLEP